MKENLDKTGLTEVYPMELGRFMLYDRWGYRVPQSRVQAIFNMPMWKSYYIDGKGRFVIVDNLYGKIEELRIEQVQNVS